MIDELYNRLMDPDFESMHGTLEQVLAVTMEDLTEYSWEDFLSEEMYDYTDKIVRKVRKSESNQTGMFEGEGSIVYGYLILYEILKQPQYLKYARKHMQIVNDLVLKDENYDLLSGNAGWIIVLMKFYEITKDKTILNYVIRVEKELWKHRTVLLNGIGWILKKRRR